MKHNRNTPQKQLIHNLINQNQNHPTADEVYELARQLNPTISRGTVYRNLNFLSETNEIRRLTMPTGPDHYDFRAGDHYHFLCRRCNKVFDTPLVYDSELNTVTPNMPGFKAEGHQLIIVGLCPACNSDK